MANKPERHSGIVGGSTAKQVMACPGSVALCKKMPAQLSGNKYADEGTLLHNVIADMLVNVEKTYEDYLGLKHEENTEIEITRELIEEKLQPAVQALDSIDPQQEMEYAIETEVDFGKFLPGVFGSCDLLGRLGSRAIVLDWKFGSGVAFEEKDNAQLMFYAAAAMRTPKVQWVFEDAEDIEMIIVQPPQVKRHIVTFSEIAAFESRLKDAVKESGKPNALINPGDHCLWCKAKAICPKMTGAVDRALKIELEGIDVSKMGLALQHAVLLEQWIKDLRNLAQVALENGVKVPYWKLVNGRQGARKWSDEKSVEKKVSGYGEFPNEEYLTKPELLSPTQMEKLFKKHKLTFSDLDDYVSRSEGKLTMAPADDPRPEAVQIGAILNKIAGRV